MPEISNLKMTIKNGQAELINDLKSLNQSSIIEIRNGLESLKEKRDRLYENQKKFNKESLTYLKKSNFENRRNVFKSDYEKEQEKLKMTDLLVAKTRIDVQKLALDREKEQLQSMVEHRGRFKRDGGNVFRRSADNLLKAAVIPRGYQPPYEVADKDGVTIVRPQNKRDGRSWTGLDLLHETRDRIKDMKHTYEKIGQTNPERMEDFNKMLANPLNSKFMPDYKPETTHPNQAPYYLNTLPTYNFTKETMEGLEALFLTLNEKHKILENESALETDIHQKVRLLNSLAITKKVKDDVMRAMMKKKGAQIEEQKRKWAEMMRRDAAEKERIRKVKELEDKKAAEEYTRQRRERLRKIEEEARREEEERMKNLGKYLKKKEKKKEKGVYEKPKDPNPGKKERDEMVKRLKEMNKEKLGEREKKVGKAGKGVKRVAAVLGHGDDGIYDIDEFVQQLDGKSAFGGEIDYKDYKPMFDPGDGGGKGKKKGRGDKKKGKKDRAKSKSKSRRSAKEKKSDKTKAKKGKSKSKDKAKAKTKGKSKEKGKKKEKGKSKSRSKSKTKKKK